MLSVCVHAFPDIYFSLRMAAGTSISPPSQGKICSHTVTNVGRGGWQAIVPTLQCSAFYHWNNLKIMGWFPYRYGINIFPMFEQSLIKCFIPIETTVTELININDYTVFLNKKKKNQDLCAFPPDCMFFMLAIWQKALRTGGICKSWKLPEYCLR